MIEPIEPIEAPPDEDDTGIPKTRVNNPKLMLGCGFVVFGPSYTMLESRC